MTDYYKIGGLKIERACIMGTQFDEETKTMSLVGASTDGLHGLVLPKKFKNHKEGLKYLNDRYVREDFPGEWDREAKKYYERGQKNGKK